MKKLVSIIIFALIFSTNLLAQDKEIKILDLYYADKDGNKVDGIILGTKYLYLVVETENAKGKKISLDLSEELEMGFIIYYKKKLVTEAFDIKVKKDIQKIKLKFNYDNYQPHNSGQAKDAVEK